jgi:hypothetical protein
MTALRLAAALGLAAVPAQADCPGDTLETARACYETLLAESARQRDLALRHGHQTACNAVQLTVNGVATQSTTTLRYVGTAVACHVDGVQPVNWRNSGWPGQALPGGMLSVPPGLSAYPPATGMPNSTGFEALDLFRGYPAMR